MIRFIYFDLGNVLINFSHEKAVSQIAELSEIEPDAVRQAIFGSDAQARYERGEITTSEFYDAFCEATGSKPNLEALLHAASDIFWTNREIVPIVCALRVAGFPLGILSNTCQAHWDHIRKTDYNVVRGIDVHCLSFEVGSTKPSREIFEAAVQMAGCQPNEIFFVDDIEDHVSGAQAAGIDATLFTSVQKLVADLHDRQIEFNY